jgi:hypothetical protein
MSYGQDDRVTEVRFPEWAGDSYLIAFISAFGPTQLPIQWVQGADSLEGYSDHSPPKAEVKNGGAARIYPQPNTSWFGWFIPVTPTWSRGHP